MSRHSTPASSRAICTASAPMSKADLSPKRPNGWRPTPMMATSSIARSSALVAAGGDRRQLEGHDIVTVGVEVEGHHLQLDVHAEAERRSEEHTSELQSLLRISYAVCFTRKKIQ